MKKIIGLSVTICLLISVMAGFSAFAADTTIYDIDFDSWDINVDATGDNPKQDLIDALKTVTGTAFGCAEWTATAFSGNAKVSTVAVEGRGNVLKISGSDFANQSSATSGEPTAELTISVPLNKDYTAAESYDADKLYIEYDLYIPSLAEVGTTYQRFQYAIFGATKYFSTKHVTSTDSLNIWAYEVTKLKEDNVTSETATRQGVSTNISLGDWYRMQYILDMKDVNAMETVNSAGATVSLTGLRTYTINTKNLRTNETTSDKIVLDSTKLASTLILGGGDQDKRMYGYYYIDNLNIYTKNKFAFASSADDETTNVAYDKKSVSFTMNAPVKADSLSGITLKAGANTVSTTAAVSANDDKTVVVTIGEDLDYSTTYTLDFSSVISTEGTAIETGDTTITFTTQAPPAIYVAETKLYNGSDVYMTDAASISADGGLYTFAAKVKSSVGESKQATAIVGVYDANGKLVSASFVGKNIPALSEEIIAAGTTIPASLAGGTVKMFLWNNVNKMQPYVKPLVENID